MKLKKGDRISDCFGVKRGIKIYKNKSKRIGFSN